MHRPTIATAEGRVVLRPLIRSLRARYSLSIALLLGPPLATLFVLTRHDDGWHYILLVTVILTIGGLLLSRVLKRAQIEIIDDGVIETLPFTGRVRIPRGEITSIRIIPVTDGNSATSFDQLFLQDSQGATRLRMRGQLWGRESVDSVAAAFDVPVTRGDVPKVMAEVRRDGLVRLYWHERHPVLRAAMIAILTVVALGPVLWFIQSLI
jgi:hypothetical protein